MPHPWGIFFDANPLGGDLYPSGGVVKLTALLCFPKHTFHWPFFTKAPPLGEIFESISPQSPTLMRVGGGGGGGGGNSIDRCIMCPQYLSS